MIKRTLFSIVFALVNLLSFGQTKADTTAIRQSDVTKWICDTTTTAKGKTSIKYYAVYKGKLVSTSKTTFEAVKLCKKHNVQCALVYITSTTGRKRIVLD